MSKMLNYKNKFMANSTLDLIPNDISWLKNSTKLIESKFIKYQFIQIYHPKNSSNFGDSDQRLLDFKDFYKFDNEKCFDAVLFYSECLRNIIPFNKKIYLCCVPSSKAGTIIDGSDVRENLSEKLC